MKEMNQADPFAAENIEGAVFLEGERCFAAYNISPILPGHSLIITRHPYLSILDLPNDEFVEFMMLARRATRLLCDAFSAHDFDWSLQTGLAAGQTVPHLHMHLIPRHDGDLPHPGDWYPRLKQFENEAIDSEGRQRLSRQEMSQIVSHLRAIARHA